MSHDIKKPSSVEVHMNPDLAVVRVKLRNLDNHLLRTILVGLWARLDQADRDDFINELREYGPMLTNPEAHPDVFLAPLSSLIAGEQKPGFTVVDWAERIKEEHTS